MIAAPEMLSQPAQAFDTLANSYDVMFTDSKIGRAQRDVVWELLGRVIEPGMRILELNCGTGEDALYLARKGAAVVACDASPRMLERAGNRLQKENPDAAVHLMELPTERLAELREGPFDGGLSNFSGLNCVANVDQAALELARLLAPAAPLVLCVSTRVCVAEIIWFILLGQPRKAFRRLSGRTRSSISGFPVDVYYPTLRELKRAFLPWFRLRSCTGVGVAVPPSYLEGVVRRWPRLLVYQQAIDQRIAHLPVFRVVGDHMLLHFERTGASLL
jgi:ubiquinone/menaquinone biosynthesis C-methylase UbiE